MLWILVRIAFQGDSNEYIQHTIILWKLEKDISILFPFVS